LRAQFGKVALNFAIFIFNNPISEPHLDVKSQVLKRLIKYTGMMVFHLTRRFVRMNNRLKAIILNCGVRSEEEEPRRERIKERGCMPK